ncbi:MarR family winged helix-turn-helix transcriptional regulator [Rhodococcus sp. IEGM1428]|uniref:MarR family winged helix-turn-helix transcriptional regulator n=1 Tax=Rhodococcus sp. IEGM1428 TaxID=3392191 RepID=UPI003D0F52B3
MPSDTELSIQAWEALFRSQVALMRRFTADDIWDPIGMREYDVLFTLSTIPNRRLRLHELNDEILLSQPSLSRMCDRLAALGYVAREPDPSDKRGTVICLTDTGADVQTTIGRKHAARIRRYVGDALNADELKTLRSLCTKLRLAQTDIREHT